MRKPPRLALTALAGSLASWPLAAAAVTIAQNALPPPSERLAPADPAPAKPPQPGPGALSADMEATLRKAGFTDLKIMPNSVFVRGKDKAGNPVAMVLDPHSMTNMVTLDPHAGSEAARGAPTLTGSVTFAAVLPNEQLTSAIIGIDVLDRKGEVLGTIRDIALDRSGLHAYVVRVGGLLGIGERYVAVTPTALQIGFDQPSGHYRASMDATAEQMKAAPEFKYAEMGRAETGRTGR